MQAQQTSTTNWEESWRRSYPHVRTNLFALPCRPPVYRCPAGAVVLTVLWPRRRLTRLLWARIAMPDSSWPRSTRCDSALTSVTSGWRLALVSSGSTVSCWRPAVHTFLLCFPGGWGRQTRRRCRFLEWTLRSLRSCWISFTQVCGHPATCTVNFYI